MIIGHKKSYQIYIYEIVNNCIFKQKKTNNFMFVFKDIIIDILI
jgi:hypothetical protein